MTAHGEVHAELLGCQRPQKVRHARETAHRLRRAQVTGFAMMSTDTINSHSSHDKLGHDGMDARNSDRIWRHGGAWT